LAQVKPFRGLLYNPDLLDDLSNIICPPYDVISSQMQTELYQRSPYNMVRLEEGLNNSTDNDCNNRYTRAASTLQKWIDSKILIRDTNPAFYVLNHRFSYGGKTIERLGFIGAVKLEPQDKEIILAHEYTRPEPKVDRLKLMEACHANFSQIMLCYRDDSTQLSSILKQVSKSVPDFSFCGGAEGNYSLWRITDSSTSKLISDSMSSKQLYIADGHHRFETALTYRNNALSKESLPDEASNFTMSYLVDFDDPGLIVQGYHRIVHTLDENASKNLWSRIREMFDIHRLDSQASNDIGKVLEEIQCKGKSNYCMGLLTAEEPPLILSLRTKFIPENMEPMSCLEAWLLEELLLKPILGSNLEQHVSWIHDPEEAAQQTNAELGSLAFLLNPISFDLFESIVKNGKKLPRKSTFFYPKVPSGLTINLLNGTI